MPQKRKQPHFQHPKQVIDLTGGGIDGTDAPYVPRTNPVHKNWNFPLGKVKIDDYPWLLETDAIKSYKLGRHDYLTTCETHVEAITLPVDTLEDLHHWMAVAGMLGARSLPTNIFTFMVFHREVLDLAALAKLVPPALAKELMVLRFPPKYWPTEAAALNCMWMLDMVTSTASKDRPVEQSTQSMDEVTVGEVAAKYGHLYMLKFIHQEKEKRGFVMDSRTFRAAVRGGHASAIAFLRERGYWIKDRVECIHQSPGDGKHEADTGGYV